MADRPFAPYNFVPFSNRILPYEGELPPHDKIDPSLHTGEIELTMTAQTPVFVSGGGDAPGFFRTPAGRFAIPGSTVRGMTRENMQILGFGLIRGGEDIKDYQIYFRDMAGRSDSGAKKYYVDALGIETRQAQGEKGRGTHSVPTKVSAGYLHRENGKFYIQPVTRTYLRVSAKTDGMAAFGYEPTARAEKVAYLEDGNGGIKWIGKRDHAMPGAKDGYILFTGKPIQNRDRHHNYVFPLEDKISDPVEISTEDKLSYEEDYETRKNALQGLVKTTWRGSEDQVRFWALPEEGEGKPVFYLRHNGHTYFGMSLFLRIGYPAPISQGLPPTHREAARDLDYLDYPHAILGYSTEKSSYRSRVSFGDLEAEGAPEELPQENVILGQPKPSWYKGYVKDGKIYDGDFRLRGYKQYWLKEKAEAPVPEKENVASHMRPLPAETVFRGVVRYKNLREEELGLLLWSLGLDEGCYQSVGMGKPYGYGRMKVSILAMRELEPAALYSHEGLTGTLRRTDPHTVTEAIDYYVSFAEEKLNLRKPLRESDEIKDFLFLHRTLRTDDEAGYMDLKGYQKTPGALPAIEEVRKGEEKRAAEQKAKEEREAQFQNIDAARAALAAKFNAGKPGNDRDKKKK